MLGVAISDARICSGEAIYFGEAERHFVEIDLARFGMRKVHQRTVRPKEVDAFAAEAGAEIEVIKRSLRLRRWQASKRHRRDRWLKSVRRTQRVQKHAAKQVGPGRQFGLNLLTR